MWRVRPPVGLVLCGCDGITLFFWSRIGACGDAAYPGYAALGFLGIECDIRIPGVRGVKLARLVVLSLAISEIASSNDFLV